MEHDQDAEQPDAPKGSVQHVEADKLPKSEPKTNPLAGSLNVTVSVPETIQIKMVDASVLADYEVWFFISSVLSSAVASFLVAYVQNQTQKSLLAMALVLAVLFAVALAMALNKRSKLRKKSKEIILRATEATEKEQGEVI